MFRKMRRNRQELDRESCEEIMRHAACGVLAVNGDDGYPYAVPMSYVYASGTIYFHAARSGHKLDALARDARVSFCVIDRDQVVPEKFTTYFRSVIAFGHARILTDEAEIRRALLLLAEKYSPGDAPGAAREIEKDLSRVCVIALTMEHMTGKEAVELVRQRENPAQ